MRSSRQAARVTGISNLLESPVCYPARVLASPADLAFVTSPDPGRVSRAASRPGRHRRARSVAGARAAPVRLEAPGVSQEAAPARRARGFLPALSRPLRAPRRRLPPRRRDRAGPADPRALPGSSEAPAEAVRADGVAGAPRCRMGARRSPRTIFAAFPGPPIRGRCCATCRASSSIGSTWAAPRASAVAPRVARGPRDRRDAGASTAST